MPRLLKQIVIAFIFFIVVGFIIYLSFFKDSALLPPPQAVIQPPQIVSERLFRIKNFDYDFLAEIKNPNVDFGATDVFYELSLFDQNNELVSVRRGSLNLLPGQIRYEVIASITVDRELAKAVFKITNADWQKTREFIPQSLFSLRSQEYLLIEPPEQGFSKLKGILFNNSNFDFDRVDIHIILFDGNNQPVAVNKTDIRTFLAKTERFFEVKWPESFGGDIRRLEINAYTDVFKNDNFIKEYGTQEKFQKFY